MRHTHRTIGWCPEVLDSCHLFVKPSNSKNVHQIFLTNHAISPPKNSWDSMSTCETIGDFGGLRLYVANLQRISPANLVENLPYQPLIQQVPLEHPKPLPPQKTQPASCNVDNLSSCKMSISNIKVRTDSSNKALDSCISSQGISIVSNGILSGDLHRPPTMRHHLWGLQFEKASKFLAIFNTH